MNNTIEGKEVDPHLLTLVAKPHMVPTEMMPFAHGCGNPDINGYTDGYISTFEAGFIVTRIRALVANILDGKNGKALPSQDKTMLARKIDALGQELFLFRGLRSNPGLLIDECQACVGENGDRLAIAADGYVFTDKQSQDRRDKGYITLDTDGQWIKDLLGRRAEGKHMIVMRQEPDGKIVLGANSRLNRDRTEICAGGFPYTGEFLEVADLTGVRFPDVSKFQVVMAIVARVHNLLYAVHKTCIGEQGLPGGTFRKWELPKK